MKILIFLKPAIWVVIISYLSLMPGGNFPRVPLFNIPGFDKIVHAGFYFVLCILFIKPFSKTIARPYLLSFLTSAIISGIIEILQANLTVTRQGDFCDLLANLAGAVAGAFVYRFMILGKSIERFA